MLIVIGAGIVGLSTAHAYQQKHPGKEVVVLEKESGPAMHQTGRNSGVIHSGIYYKPGSRKAELCKRGIGLLRAFADEHGIATERCGKVIVAAHESEIPRLDDLHQRGQRNGVECRLIAPDELRELEPHARGVRALHVADAGIIDYRAVCEALCRSIQEHGGEVRFGCEVAQIKQTDGAYRVVSGQDQSITGSSLISCAGLHADRIARLSGLETDARIVPFRGEYYELTPRARRLCNNLIYPVPDPRFPFLGVHLTRMIHGDEHGHRIECGPNAVLALAREGYSRRRISARDMGGLIGSGSFWRFALRHWRYGIGEMHRSLSKAAFVRALQRLIPEISSDDLVPAPAGVRAQAMGPGGHLHDDFVIEHRGRTIGVINAPSPAATSGLAIGETIVEKLDQFEA